jgi:hypothetical protein
VGNCGHSACRSSPETEPRTTGTARQWNFVGGGNGASLRRAHRWNPRSGAIRHRKRTGSNGEMGGKENASACRATADDDAQRKPDCCFARPKWPGSGWNPSFRSRCSNCDQHGHQHRSGRLRTMGILQTLRHCDAQQALPDTCRLCERCRKGDQRESTCGIHTQGRCGTHHSGSSRFCHRHSL